MARMIRHESTGPYKLEPQPKAVWICMCGLSRNLPFCDSSHKQCAAEVAGQLYDYDAPAGASKPPATPTTSPTSGGG